MRILALPGLLVAAALTLGACSGAPPTDPTPRPSPPVKNPRTASALTSSRPTADPAPAPPPPPRADPAPAPAIPGDSNLAALRSKELGEVAPSVGKKEASRVAMLRAICERVVDHKNKRLGCEECVDCGTDPRLKEVATELVEALPGSFTRPGADQALVITKAATLEAYTHRYFLLEKRDGRFWVVNTFKYYGRPYDMRLLKMTTGSNLVAMRMATPGAPPVSDLRVWRLSEGGAHHATLVSGSAPFLTCRPSGFELADYIARDKDNDKDDDITVLINDFAPELEKEAVVQRLEQACSSGQDLRPASKRLTFELTFELDHFEASDAYVARLSLDSKKVGWSAQAWDLAAASEPGK